MALATYTYTSIESQKASFFFWKKLSPEIKTWLQTGASWLKSIAVAGKRKITKSTCCVGSGQGGSFVWGSFRGVYRVYDLTFWRLCNLERKRGKVWMVDFVMKSITSSHSKDVLMGWFTPCVVVILRRFLKRNFLRNTPINSWFPHFLMPAKYLDHFLCNNGSKPPWSSYGRDGHEP